MRRIIKNFPKGRANIFSRFFTSSPVVMNNDAIHIIFHEKKSGNIIQVKGEIGKRILDIALDSNIDIEGACGGELACSTCHVICSQLVYDNLPFKSEEEEDMLDLAFGRTNTSRLCCQIVLNSSLDGAQFIVPDEYPTK